MLLQQLSNHFSIITFSNHAQFRTNTGPYILSLDFSKAFDSVYHHLILYILKKIGVPQCLAHTIYHMNNSASSAICMGSLVSPSFDARKSVRQGCPLSSTLFCLTLNPLSHAIENNPEIQGMTILNNRLNVIAHADDVPLFLNDEHSLTHLFNVLQNFATISGFNLNWSEIEIIPFKLNFFIPNMGRIPQNSADTNLTAKQKREHLGSTIWCSGNSR